MTVTMRHFTCDHVAARLQVVDGFVMLRPHPQRMLGGIPLVWFTYMRYPTRESLGLTSHSLRCDRMARVFEVCEPNHDVRYWSEIRKEFPREGVLALEAARGAMPGFWCVSASPVRAVEVQR